MTATGSLDPSTLAALDPTFPCDLSLQEYKNTPRSQGSLRMLLRRPSRMPEYSREYAPGDPVNRIDWKAFARTDQLIVRLVRDEAAANVRLFVEAGPSMPWPTPDEAAVAQFGGPTKLAIALRIALNLAYAHLRQGDTVALWLVTHEDLFKPSSDLARVEEALILAPVRRWRPRSPADVMGAFNDWFRDDATSPGLQDLEAVFVPQPYPDGNADRAWWIGDGLGQTDCMEWLDDVDHAAMLQVLSGLEVDIDWINDDTSYFDESRGRKEYLGQALRHQDQYRDGLQRWQQRLRKRLQGRGFDLFALTETTPLAEYQGCVSGSMART